MNSIYSGDTIAARATAPGEGGIAIVRISGPDCARVIGKVFRAANGKSLVPRMLTFGQIMDGDTPCDEAMAVLMPGPHSYTREDVAEIQCHGSDALVRKVLGLVMKYGARMAKPGEFTYRAFHHGRIDLTQAEAVMRMIHADSERALSGAMRQLSGGVSGFIRTARGELTALLASLSAAIDFPDEVEESETAQKIRERCAGIRENLLAHCNPKAGRIEEEGLRVVLAGRPNAGKSSLLNALTESDRAIVTDIPGTTRDTLTESILLDGVRVRLTDTAGLRESTDAVERIGVDRAKRALEEADVRVLVLDSAADITEEDIAALGGLSPQMIVLTKGDLEERITPMEAAARFGAVPVVRVCAPTGEGLSQLRQMLLGFVPPMGEENALLSQMRHVQTAEHAAQSLADAVSAIDNGLPLDVCAIDISAALDLLGEITGEVMNEQVIDEIFSRFCVGK